MFDCIRPELDLPRSDIRIAIEGFGNAGMKFARLAAKAGHIVTAVSDSSGVRVGGPPVAIPRSWTALYKLKASNTVTVGQAAKLLKR